jgi:predicted DNA-binding transcriptional regulator AlpA
MALESFDSLPDSALVRVQVVAALRACSVATVWNHAASGLLPKPEKFGGITAWRVGALRQAMASS